VKQKLQTRALISKAPHGVVCEVIGSVRSPWFTECRIERGVPGNLHQFAVAEDEPLSALVALPRSGQGQFAVRVNPTSDRFPPKQHPVSRANWIIHYEQRYSLGPCFRRP